MVGKVKMRDLHNLIDLIEKVCIEAGEEISLSFTNCKYGGFNISVFVYDVIDEKSYKIKTRKHWYFYADSELLQEESAAKYADCKEYLGSLLCKKDGESNV